MGAYAATRNLFRMPVAGTAFRRSAASEATAPHGRVVRIERIRNILRQTGYTAARLSLATAKLYGSRSPYFIAPTFLYKLKCGVTPQICQIVALSEITGYRFVDWMKLCGFDLHQIPRLQLQLHTEHTVLVTPIEFESASFLSPSWWPDEAVRGSSVNSRPDQDGRGRGRYRFAKIGRSDALGCPGLKPGSLVRVDRSCRRPSRDACEAWTRNLLWLVELPNGLTCCHVRWMGDQGIILLPKRAPWGSWPLRVPTEARILGLVDMELPSQEVAMQARARPLKLEPRLPCGKERTKVSNLLRVSRCRTGLTYREAQRLTRVIANIQGNPDYSVALGLLSDYEAMGGLPRHIAKIVSLCITYCMDIRELMEVAGVNIDDSAKIPLVMHNHSVQADADLLDVPPDFVTTGIGARYSPPASGRLENFSQI